MQNMLEKRRSCPLGVATIFLKGFPILVMLFPRRRGGRRGVHIFRLHPNQGYRDSIFGLVFDTTLTLFSGTYFLLTFKPTTAWVVPPPSSFTFAMVSSIVWTIPCSTALSLRLEKIMVYGSGIVFVLPLLVEHPPRGASLGKFTQKRAIFLMDRIYVQVFLVFLYLGGLSWRKR